MNENVPSLNSEMLKMERSNNEFGPDLWLRLADEDYVTTRLLVYYDLNRLATYHMQQAVEKYLKSFIVKHYQIYNESTEKLIIKGCKNNNGYEIRFQTHDLNKLLKCCQEKNDFFKDRTVKEFINILEKFDTIRYPHQLEIDYEIIQYLDYFASKVRDIINIKIIDLISHLQLGPVINLSYGVEMNEYREIFFHRNEYFKKIDSEKDKPDLNKCPLSVESWIIILNDEIRNLKYPNLMDTLNPILIALIAFIGFMIASLNTPLLSLFSSIWRPIWIVFGVLISIGVITFLISCLDTHKKIKSYDIIKDKMIFGELTDSNKIREEWKKVVDSSNVMLIFIRKFLKN